MLHETQYGYSLAAALSYQTDREAVGDLPPLHFALLEGATRQQQVLWTLLSIIVRHVVVQLRSQTDAKGVHQKANLSRPGTLLHCAEEAAALGGLSGF